MLFFFFSFFVLFLDVRLESSFFTHHIPADNTRRGTTKGIFSEVKIGLGKGRETDAIESCKYCSQLPQKVEKPLGLRTFFAQNPFEKLTQRGALASHLWRALTRVYDVPFWYLPTFRRLDRLKLLHRWKQVVWTKYLTWRDCAMLHRWKEKYLSSPCQVVWAWLLRDKMEPPPLYKTVFIWKIDNDEWFSANCKQKRQLGVWLSSSGNKNFNTQISVFFCFRFHSLWTDPYTTVWKTAFNVIIIHIKEPSLISTTVQFEIWVFYRHYNSSFIFEFIK